MRYVCPDRFCRRKNHDECWAEYARLEDEAKYRGMG